MKIFFYGGSGYLGSSLISSLCHKYKFFISTRKKNTIFNKNFEIINIKDKKKLIQKLKHSDLIIIANGPSSKDSIKNLFSYLSYLNDQIDLIIKYKKKRTRVIYFSSIHVYENKELPKAKTSDLLNSKSHYAIRNIICENLLLSRLENHKINIIRISNIFGIHETIFKFYPNMFKLAVNQFCLSIIKKKNFT